MIRSVVSRMRGLDLGVGAVIDLASGFRRLPGMLGVLASILTRLEQGLGAHYTIIVIIRNPQNSIGKY